MTMIIKQIIQDIEKDFIKNSNKQKSLEMSAYMKNNFTFYGVQTPLRNEILKLHLPKIKELAITDILELGKNLWDKDYRELHYFALDILIKSEKKWNLEIINTLEYISKNNQWWDSIDPIASKLFGTYFKLFPENKNEKIKEYSENTNFWINRVAILFQLGYGNLTDKDILFKIIKQHSNSDEFFIQKAIGWALRQYSYKNKQDVINFIESNDLKPLSKREGLKAIKRNENKVV